MRAFLAWLGSGAFAAALALAIAATLYGNRDDAGAGWFGGSAVLLAFMAGALPMTLAHVVAFRWLRPGDPLPLRMTRAAIVGLCVFGVVIGGLTLLAHRV